MGNPGARGRHLDHVELVDVQLIHGRSCRNVADVVTEHRHDVAMAEVASNGRLTSQAAHHAITVVILENDCLYCNLQVLPLPCTHPVNNQDVSMQWACRHLAYMVNNCLSCCSVRREETTKSRCSKYFFIYRGWAHDPITCTTGVKYHGKQCHILHDPTQRRPAAVAHACHAASPSWPCALHPSCAARHCLLQTAGTTLVPES